MNQTQVREILETVLYRELYGVDPEDVEYIIDMILEKFEDHGAFTDDEQSDD